MYSYAKRMDSQPTQAAYNTHFFFFFTFAYYLKIKENN